jgi:hypothetical protein
MDKRYVSDGSCIQCAILRAEGRYRGKKALILGQRSERYAKDSEIIKKRVAKRKIEHPEKVRVEKRAEYEKHKRAYINRAAKWNKSHKPVLAALQSKRRCAKIQRTPLWLSTEDHKTIVSVYEESSSRTKETGIRHNVDHVVPLQGKLVCGLHVPWNLQVITASENSSKYNNF